MAWPEISAVVVLGLGGSFGHCIGMCGGFALAIGRGANGFGGVLGRHLAYQAGKALTYVFLAVLVTAGVGWVGRAGWFGSGQMVLSILAGAFMLLYGFMQVAEWRPAGGWSRLLEPLPGCRALATVASRPGVLPAFLTGWLNGFLPCGLVLAALAQLASTGSIAVSVIGAAAFGLATFPGLFALGLAAQAWNPRWRRRLVRITGVLLIVFGLLTIVRAFPAGRAWLMENVVPHVSWGAIKEWCGF
jgi:sulfite exporter TauE/SafE